MSSLFRFCASSSALSEGKSAQTCGRILATALWLPLFVFLVACQPSPVVELSAATVQPPEQTVPLAPALINVKPTERPPQIRVVEPTATPLPALLLPRAEDLATATSLPTATASPLPTVTKTPQPTFTPPALPGTSPNEHYWLRRPIADGGVVWTDKIYPYGSTRSGTLRPHHGVEFNVVSGTPVHAAASGTVVVAGDDSQAQYGPQRNFYGTLVVIEHETRYNQQPVFTLYGHLSGVTVVPGQKVTAQQIIGYSGSTGVADGPHLHFEVRIASNSYDATRNPALWLYPFRDHGTVAGRVRDSSGALVDGILVTVTRIDAPSPYKATTTYVGSGVNADGGWQENFVIDDVQAGYYSVNVKIGEKRYSVETWVYPYRTSFVEIVID